MKLYRYTLKAVMSKCVGPLRRATEIYYCNTGGSFELWRGKAAMVVLSRAEFFTIG